MTNKVTLVGRIGADPEIRTLQSGDRVVTFSVATEERWKDKQSGERKSKTEWHRVESFSPGDVKFCEEYIQKGDQVLVLGTIKYGKFTDKDGVERYTTTISATGARYEIKLLASTKPNGAGKAAEQQEGPDLDDEIPF